MYKFILVSSNGSVRSGYHSVKEAFDDKTPHEQVYVVLVETGSRFRVLRP